MEGFLLWSRGVDLDLQPHGPEVSYGKDGDLLPPFFSNKEGEQTIKGLLTFFSWTASCNSLTITLLCPVSLPAGLHSQTGKQ